ncbi:hypothetical protein KBA41_17710 [Candidatus Ozemobacteraceae bacterium]|nr:hypothetical protein [Candidatus Ozemobacteraceae bacterium]
MLRQAQHERERDRGRYHAEITRRFRRYADIWEKEWRFLMTGMPLMLATVLTMILSYEISVEL